MYCITRFSIIKMYLRDKECLFKKELIEKTNPSNYYPIENELRPQTIHKQSFFLTFVKMGI